MDRNIEKPDFRKIAKEIVETFESSVFADAETLEAWITTELQKTWTLAMLLTEDKCEKFAIEKGWINVKAPDFHPSSTRPAGARAGAKIS